MRDRGALGLVYGVGLAWCALDQWSKHAIGDGLFVGEVRPVLEGWLALTHAHNTGAAWSLAAGNPRLLGLLSAVVCLGLLAYERRFFPRSAWQSLALGLLVGGAAGNMLDRLGHGYVVDMLYVQWHGRYFFPIFNVADVGINVGVALLLLAGLLAARADTQPRPVD